MNTHLTDKTNTMVDRFGSRQRILLPSSPSRNEGFERRSTRSSSTNWNTETITLESRAITADRTQKLVIHRNGNGKTIDYENGTLSSKQVIHDASYTSNGSTKSFCTGRINNSFKPGSSSSKSSSSFSRLTAIIRKASEAVVALRSFVYYLLVNLFVCEKRLLHHTPSSIFSLLRKILLGALICLFGGIILCLLAPVLASVYSSAQRMLLKPSFSQDTTGNRYQHRSSIEPSYGSDKYSEVLSRIDRLEKSFSEFKRDRSNHLADQQVVSPSSVNDLRTELDPLKQELLAEVSRKDHERKSAGEEAEARINAQIKSLQEEMISVEDVRNLKDNLQLQHELLQRLQAVEVVTNKISSNQPILSEEMAAKFGNLQNDLLALKLSVEENHRKIAADVEMTINKIESKLTSEMEELESRTQSVNDAMNAKLSSMASNNDNSNDEAHARTLLPLILPKIIETVADRADTKVCNEECINNNKVCDCDSMDSKIKAAIARYDADKTGQPDMALEPSGGSIVSTRCTKSSRSKSSVLTLWGWRLWSYSNTPRSIIQPGVVPGDCWAIEGATAEVVIQLIAPTVISGFSLEHIPKSISPYGVIDTAPRHFEVWGLTIEHDVASAWMYGSYEYKDSDEPLQYFDVQNRTEIAFPMVELKILSNHGNVKSMCVYRFRVHGTLL